MAAIPQLGDTSHPSGAAMISLASAGTAAKNRPVTLSRREKAQPLRGIIEKYLSSGTVVELDCSGVDATQSFMDELIGIIVLERGPDVLAQFKFLRCSEDMKAVINYVVNDRANQHRQNPHFFAPR